MGMDGKVVGREKLSLFMRNILTRGVAYCTYATKKTTPVAGKLH